MSAYVPNRSRRQDGVLGLPRRRWFTALFAVFGPSSPRAALIPLRVATGTGRAQSPARGRCLP